MRPSQLLVAGALAFGTIAQKILGFNSGSTLVDRSAKFKADFAAEFTTARGLENAPGLFSAVRLYTNIQAYSQDDPIQAFEAAIETKTSILLGIWASGTDSISKELTALKKAVDMYGKPFTDLVIGISIGSEDLYRISVTGITNGAGIGNSPAAILGFINDFKQAFANTTLATIPVGHVDTWDAWTNATNKPVLDAIDFIGVNEFPYYESGKGNDIKNAGRLFDRAFDAVLGVAGGKPVWLTETGWPTTGPNWDLAVPSVENAKYYWNEIGCRRLFGKVPAAFWYTLRDSNPDNKMKFAITNNLSTKPLFDLTCPTTFDTPTATTMAPTSSTTGGSSGGSASGGTGSGSGSGSVSSSRSGSVPSASSTPSSAAASVHVFSVATYALIVFSCAFFALF